MSLYARAVILRSGKIGQLPEGRYKGIIVTAEAEAGNTTNTEVWSSPGIMGVPPDESAGLRVPMAGGSSDVIVAVKTKLTPPALAKGEAMFFATDSAGETLKANIKARADGTLEINGLADFATLWTALNTALQTYNTAVKAHLSAAGDPASGTLTLDISAAKATTVKMG